MRSMTRSRSARAFTIFEMIIAMFIMAIVMSVAALEFQSVIYQHMFLESHLTAEQQARVAIAKVSGAARQTSVDISDFPTPPPPVIQPASTPGPILEFYQVASLQPGEMPTPGGIPKPCYNTVTIALNKQIGETVGTIEETIAPVSGPCVPAPPVAPLVLARNVADFQVSYASGVANSGAGYRIDVLIYDQEDNTIDQRMGASYHLSSVFTPLVFGKAE
jgi:prepilin-type N-terminal cleavage/methylation domain-containing protein